MRCLHWLLILLIVLLPAGPFATTFPVTKTADTDDGTCDPDCSLREAIGAANTNPGADDVPVPAGTYLLTLGQLVVSDAVSIAGAGQATTIIDGNAADRVFDIEASSGVVAISGVTIRNGYVLTYGGSSGFGGGIRTYADLGLTDSTVSNNTAYAGGGIGSYYGGDLTLTNSTVSNNTADYGGGIRSYLGGDLALTNSTVSNNTANIGGGIRNISYYGDLLLTDSTVSNNTAYSSGGGIDNRSVDGDFTLINSTVSGNTASVSGGGGIQDRSNYGDFTLTNSTVSNNTAYYGGGISSYVLTLTNSTVSNNTAGYIGGGIASYVMTLTNSTVSNNTAEYYGGGIAAYTLTLTNSTVSNNTAAYYGGGISGYNLTLTNSTVSGNSAGYEGSGIKSSYGGSATLTNTIVADNGTSTPNCNIAVDSLGYNLTDDDSCGLTEPTDLVVTDAMLGPLQDNGGPTETQALLTGSPAIDAGSPACPPPDTDQRGVSRPQGVACDIGAFELVIGTITADIDIRPGSNSNPIHPSGRGKLPVAILGSDTFNVAEVDVTTLAFGPDAAEPSHDLTKPGAFEDHLRDVNDDGLTDLVSHYRTQETGITSDDLEGCMTGATLEGTLFEGCDVIRAVSGGRRIRR